MNKQAKIPIEKVDRNILQQQEDEAFTLVNVIRYCLCQLFEEVKSGITFLLFFLLDSKSRDILLRVRRRGFDILKNYDLGESLSSIDANCNKAKKEVEDVLELPGSYRYKRLEKYNDNIEKLTKNKYFKKLNLFYTLRNSVSVTMLSDTTELDSKSRKITSNDYFADYAHFDLYYRQLKFAIALTDIKSSNGPTEFLPHSSGYKFKAFRSYFSSWLATKKIVVGGKPFLPENFYNNLKKKCGSELITIDKGDILVFDSRTFHRATHLTKGTRKILWLYY